MTQVYLNNKHFCLNKRTKEENKKYSFISPFFDIIHNLKVNYNGQWRFVVNRRLHMSIMP
jgi:hypothetical protein